jgi:uncharacterized protein
MKITRRKFVNLSGGALLGAAGRPRHVLGDALSRTAMPALTEFGYGDVTIDSTLHQAQLQNTHDVLMGLSEDSLLRPFRQMAGQRAPGADLGGWYKYDPDFDWHKDDAGFAPGATFGQWVSALSRYYAITGSEEVREKVLRLNRMYAQTISGKFYDNNRFPAYCYDKLVLGLIDSQQLVNDAMAFKMLDRTTQAAEPYLPRAAVDRELEWRPGKDQSYRWDESYTNPENLFLAYQRGAGSRYRQLALRFLDDSTWFDPLSRGENVLATKHAYSYVNSLSSAMQAYLTMGSEKHLRAAKNAFAMLSAQSYPTGGWGPDEKLVSASGDELYSSLRSTHNTFETPCGSYAHFKLTRYLLCVTGDSRYGDSMERVMYNTVLGVKPMMPDGRAFYYADHHFQGRKVYSNHRFPCCSGTLPQVAADYRINTYFRDREGVVVNLYIPSSVRWRQGGVECSLRQSGDYPFADTIALRVGVSRPREFAVRLRIPGWAGRGTRVAVNGKAWEAGAGSAGTAEPGRFASVRRVWRDDDRIEVELPRVIRVEAVDAGHPETVALVSGPVVLFPVSAGARSRQDGVLVAGKAEVLGARQTGLQKWETGVRGQPVVFLPYVAIQNEEYSTFFRVEG